MLLTNISPEGALFVSSMGATIGAGATFSATTPQAAGLLIQQSNFSPADSEATAFLATLIAGGYTPAPVPAFNAATYMLALAAAPDVLITGTVTRDTNGAAVSAAVTWPDGSPGTFTTLVASTAFPGAVDSYKITYGSPVTKTYTQPTITRDPTSGAAVVPIPTITVS